MVLVTSPAGLASRAIPLYRKELQMNPIPFNPHLALTGRDQRDALDTLSVIFDMLCQLYDHPDLCTPEDLLARLDGQRENFARLHPHLKGN